MMKNIKIGTCGFRSTKEEYVRRLSAVEVQHTFYQPPQIATLERWRAAVPGEFEFAVKAWQLITHEAKSPTYKRLKRQLTDREKAEAGRFKPTEIVSEAWQTTRACAEALRARAILFQCPASFRQTKENIDNLQKFFAGIERGEFIFAWEPRGDWSDEIVKNICEESNLRHTVDPFIKITTTPDQIYYRLHGRNGWRYKYEEDELTELCEMLPDGELSYIFFNNREMTEDAEQFQNIIRDSA